jgi:hypothetical protein
VSIACQTVSEPDLNALLRWLDRPALRSSDGRILSWISPTGRRTGYAYDEATALLARLYRWLDRPAGAEPLVGALRIRIDDGGWLGKDGISYVFDTALALPLLPGYPDVLDRVVNWVEARRSCAPVRHSDWWSQSFGAHQLKCAPIVANHGRPDLAHGLARELLDECFDGQRFRIHGRSDATYVHSHCYALEGLVGLGGYDEAALAGADWLAQLQHSDGTLPAWVNADADERYPSDVVAQAIRIWSLLAPDRYADPITRALSHLALMQDPASGGIRYEPRSDDLTSWVAVFAVQALLWAANPPGPEARAWLI